MSYYIDRSKKNLKHVKSSDSYQRDAKKLPLEKGLNCYCMPILSKTITRYVRT